MNAPLAACLSTCLMTWLMTWLPAPPQHGSASDSWLVVRGGRELTAPMSYARLVEVYLGGTARVVAPDAAAGAAERNRMLVGTPADNALLRELLPELGVALDGDALVFREQRIGPGRGLVLVRDDLDGEGLMTVMTGADAEGLFACFTVTIDVLRSGFTVVERNRTVAAGDLARELDTREPVVVRLDLDLERLLADAASWTAPERELRAARGLAGWTFVIQAAGGGQYDAERHVAAVRADASGLARRAREAFAGRDLTAEVLVLYERVLEAVIGESARVGPAPAFYMLNDPSVGTNGKTFNADPVTGRPSVLLNLAPLARDGNFETVALHESLHTFQAPDAGPTRVIDRGRREGVATAATQILAPGLPDAAALLWSDAELDAARARADDLVRAFRRDAASTDAGLLRAWFTLGVEPPVAGAPSRSGYYVMWSAARAWRDGHPGATLCELIDVPAEELLAALD